MMYRMQHIFKERNCESLHQDCEPLNQVFMCVFLAVFLAFPDLLSLLSICFPSMHYLETVEAVCIELGRSILFKVA